MVDNFLARKKLSWRGATLPEVLAVLVVLSILGTILFSFLSQSLPWIEKHKQDLSEHRDIQLAYAQFNQVLANIFPVPDQRTLPANDSIKLIPPLIDGIIYPPISDIPGGYEAVDTLIFATSANLIPTNGITHPVSTADSPVAILYSIRLVDRNIVLQEVSWDPISTDPEDPGNYTLVGTTRTIGKNIDAIGFRRMILGDVSALDPSALEFPTTIGLAFFIGTTPNTLHGRDDVNSRINDYISVTGIVPVYYDPEVQTSSGESVIQDSSGVFSVSP